MKNINKDVINVRDLLKLGSDLAEKLEPCAIDQKTWMGDLKGKEKMIDHARKHEDISDGMIVALKKMDIKTARELQAPILENLDEMEKFADEN